MDSIVTSSGLAVCYQGAEYATVARALKRLDERLLLDKERDGQGRDRWVVRVRVGDDPRDWPTPVAWVDPDGTPRPLSLGIVDQLRAQEVTAREQIVNGTRLAESARHVRERAADDARQAREDLYREHEHRLSAGHGRPVTISTPLRGPS